MSDELHLDASKKMQDIIRDTVKGNSQPASVELIGQVYSDLVTVRDITISLTSIIAALPLTSDQIVKIKKVASSLEELQAGIGSGLRLLGRDAFGDDNE